MLELRVQPAASRDEISRIANGRIAVRISAPPVDGGANEKPKEFLAKEFGVSRGRVKTFCGRGGQNKPVAIVKPRRTPRRLK